MRLKKETIISACQASLLPCVHIAPVPGAAPGPLDSKFGGDFYLPAGVEAPEMEFLAQINFAQVPHLEGFPERGLLQFFLCTDDTVVEDQVYDEFAWQSGSGIFQVIYYPDTVEGSSGQESIPKERWFTGKITGGMKFEPAEEIATISIGEEGGFLIDLGFESLKDVLNPIFQAAWEEDKNGEDEDDEDEDDEDLEEEEGVYDLENSCEDTEKFACDFGNWGFKLGGHPSLRQTEFRLEEDYDAYSVLLFQYDLTPPDDASDIEQDTFCFFIKPEDLKACRFDDILMVHHNCY